MLLIQIIIFPLAIGCIVTGWQGFKDTPWEGFHFSRYFRSFITAFVLTLITFFFSKYTQFIIRQSVLFLLLLGAERVVGEMYKGFFRPSLHPEFEKLFERVHMPQLKAWPIRLVSGGLSLLAIIFMIFCTLYVVQGFVLAIHLTGMWRNILAGFFGGSLSAIGGAIKDSQFEGFKPKKFIRSPLVGALGGFLIGHFEQSFFVLVLATTGFERIIVECYKTFLRKQTRGIFENKEIKYSHWETRRYIFFLQYLVGVSFFLFLLTNT